MAHDIVRLIHCVQGGVYVPISNLSVTAKYLPPLPIGGAYMPGYGTLQDQFPLVFDVSFLLNYYGKNTVLLLLNVFDNAPVCRRVTDES